MNYVQIVDEVFSQFSGPQFSVKFWNGEERFYGQEGSKTFSLVLKNEFTAKRLLAQGALGFGESFMDGSLHIEGDIEAYLRLRHQFKHIRHSLSLMFATLVAHATVPKNREDQIAYHYDLGNDFFQMILDINTMSYSAGRYPIGTEDLASAQIKKLELICEWLAVPEGATLLDLGSGWGGFALHAAKRHAWNVTGYTLSNAQLQYCQRLRDENHLQDSLSFAYLDMTKQLPPKLHDAVVILESVEHVGKKHLPNFFKQVAQTLKPHAPVYVQYTGRYTPYRVDPWTLKYVFPGGYLPSKNELIEAATHAGFDIERFEDYSQDYVHTMAAWIQNLEAHKNDIEKQFDPAFYRLWYLWMHGAKVAFELGSMNLFRVLLRRKT